LAEVNRVTFPAFEFTDRHSSSCRRGDVAILEKDRRIQQTGILCRYQGRIRLFDEILANRIDFEMVGTNDFDSMTQPLRSLDDIRSTRRDIESKGCSHNESRSREINREIGQTTREIEYLMGSQFSEERKAKMRS
jgi:hypothetical protein